VLSINFNSARIRIIEALRHLDWLICGGIACCTHKEMDSKIAHKQ